MCITFYNLIALAVNRKAGLGLKKYMGNITPNSKSTNTKKFQLRIWHIKKSFGADLTYFLFKGSHK